MNVIEKYVIQNNEWEKIDLVAPKFNFTLTGSSCFQSTDSEIMLFGGKIFSKNERQDKIYKFNIETKEMRQSKEKLPLECECPQSAQYINGVQYVFGWNEKGISLISYSLLKNYWAVVNQINI